MVGYTITPLIQYLQRSGSLPLTSPDYKNSQGHFIVNLVVTFAIEPVGSFQQRNKILSTQAKKKRGGGISSFSYSAKAPKPVKARMRKLKSPLQTLEKKQKRKKKHFLLANAASMSQHLSHFPKSSPERRESTQQPQPALT